jgi:hypothetical protein
MFSSEGEILTSSVILYIVRRLWGTMKEIQILDFEDNPNILYIQDVP